MKVHHHSHSLQERQHCPRIEAAGDPDQGGIVQGRRLRRQQQRVLLLCDGLGRQLSIQVCYMLTKDEL